jgi:hypothetical protein
VEPERIDEILSKRFFDKQRLWFGCPKRTLITDEYGLGLSCSVASGCLARPSNDLFESISLGDINYEKGGDTLKIVFKDLYAIPRDYIGTPQMYWVSSAANMVAWRLLVSGIVLTVAGVVLWVIAITLSVVAAAVEEDL